ncbi:MAG: hypothetical protein Kow0068_23370 [Marinilabiliales bacterium]
MKKHFIIYCISLLIINIANAQINDDNEPNIFQRLENGKPKVNIHQNYEIKQLVLNHIKVNEKIDYGFNGYRIRIFSAKGANAKKRALEVKADFLKKYPEIDSYLTYINPDFRIVVGDFRTKSEAKKFLIEIKKDFPEAFIVKDIVKLKK